MRGSAVDRVVRAVTVALAAAGGAVLTAMALVTVASIAGRSLIWAGLGPIPGDFELVEIGCAVAVFGFLPYCHLTHGHVTVDIFASRLPRRAFNALTLLGDLSIAVIAVIVAWRLWFGLAEKLAYGETTMILGAPIWIGYAACFAAAIWMVIVGLHVLARDLGAMREGLRLP